jgi:hypothetical protein
MNKKFGNFINKVKNAQIEARGWKTNKMFPFGLRNQASEREITNLLPTKAEMKTKFLWRGLDCNIVIWSCYVLSALRIELNVGLKLSEIHSCFHKSLMDGHNALSYNC